MDANRQTDLSRFHRLDLVLVCGLPGSGKSHFSSAFFKHTSRKRVNRKEIRRLVFEMTNFGEEWHEKDFTNVDEFLVKHAERRIIEHLLQNGQQVLIDNTSVSATSRGTYLKIAAQLKKSIGVIFLDVPLEKCLSRNRERTDPIPEPVISNLLAAVDRPTKAEGFGEVLTVRDY